MSAYAEVLSALSSDAAVPRADVQRWIDSGELLTWSAVYALIESAGTRIDPGLTPEQHVDFTRRYLLRCIEENPVSGEHLHGGYEAAWTLAAALKEWRRRGGRLANMVRGVALDLEKIYRRGDPATKNRVLCGVLEHAFEDPAMRPHFVDWEREEDLREAYHLALEWGAAHE